MYFMKTLYICTYKYNTNEQQHKNNLEINYTKHYKNKYKKSLKKYKQRHEPPCESDQYEIKKKKLKQIMKLYN